MKHRIIAILFMTSTGFLLACSKSSGGGKTQTKTIEQIETEMYGPYQAILSPINTTVSGHLNGSVTIVRERDEVVVDVRFSNGPASVLHAQTIHIGNRCPTVSDDVNADGYVDAQEAALVHQEVLIPLDDDISSQHMGLGTYPATDQYGYYFWSRATSYDKLIDDLREDDINPSDEYVKLDNEKSLTMIDKVIIIRGVPETTPLPETVKGFGRMGSHQALPVACGVIRRLGKAPGEIDQDDSGLPVPPGETIGGSSGADDGADFPTSNTTSGDTGNYGEDEEGEVITRSNEVGPGITSGNASGN